MGKVTCDVCGREIDSRGLSGHMKTHPDTQGVRSPKGSQQLKDEGKNNGVISYPSNEQKGESQVSQDNTPGKDTIPNTKGVKKPPASNPASKIDPRGERKKEPEKEWQGLFR